MKLPFQHGPDYSGPDVPRRPLHQVYLELRSKVLSVDAETIGLPATTYLCGALMELGIESGVVSVVALTDGTASLYASSGSVLVGGGTHVQVARAAKGFLDAVEHSVGVFVPDTASGDLPDPDFVFFRALTCDGPLIARCKSSQLKSKADAFWPVYYAGQSLLAALRESEAKRDT